MSYLILITLIVVSAIYLNKAHKNLILWIGIYPLISISLSVFGWYILSLHQKGLNVDLPYYDLVYPSLTVFYEPIAYLFISMGIGRVLSIYSGFALNGILCGLIVTYTIFYISVIAKKELISKFGGKISLSLAILIPILMKITYHYGYSNYFNPDPSRNDNILTDNQAYSIYIGLSVIFITYIASIMFSVRSLENEKILSFISLFLCFGYTISIIYYLI